MVRTFARHFSANAGYNVALNGEGITGETGMLRTTCVVSVLCCALFAPAYALEPLDGEDVPEIYFRDDAEPSASSPQSTSAGQAVDENNSTAGRRSATRHARPSANSYLFVSNSSSLDRDQDGYTLKGSTGATRYGFAWSAHEYVSVLIGRAESDVDAEYDPLTVINYATSQQATLTRTFSSDVTQDNAEVMLFLLGRSVGTPFVSWRRWRSDGTAHLEDTIRVSSLFGGPAVTDTYRYELALSRAYGTTWSVGYEHALWPQLALSAQAFHSIADDQNARSVALNADVGVTDAVRLNVGLSRSHETSEKVFNLGLKWLP